MQTLPAAEKNRLSTQEDQGADHGPPAVSKPKIAVIGFILLLVALLAGAAGILTRIHASQRLTTETHASAVPDVLVIAPRQGASVQEIVLPGNIQAYRDAPIYARTSGYLNRWTVDIGRRVRKGQLLAIIESPEVDQQLQQARADLSTAQSNLELAQATSARYADLLKTNSVSRQDAENQSADARARQSMVHSAEANVRRLEELQSFERITAPFDGVVTARNTDVGQLINAGNASAGSNAITGSTASSGGNARELFHIAATNPLRVYINVPQMYSRDAKPSTTADLTLAQYPGRRFPGRLVRNAGAIDQGTRTLLTEVDVPNAKGELLPGSYAQVHLKLSAGAPSLRLPVSALIFRENGLQVAVLDGDRARLVPITVGRDLGTEVEVATGITIDQKIIDSPPDSLADSEPVRVIEARPGAPAPQ